MKTTDLFDCKNCKYKSKYDDHCFIFNLSFKEINRGDIVYFDELTLKKHQGLASGLALSRGNQCPYSILLKRR